MRYFIRNIISLSVFATCSLLTSNSALAHKIMIDKTNIDFPSNIQEKRIVNIKNVHNSDNAYVTVKVKEVVSIRDGKTVEFNDPRKMGIIATPSMLTIKPNQTLPVSIININDRLDKERVYRVEFTPVISDIDKTEKTTNKMIKVLIGYDTLVHVQPDNPRLDYAYDIKDDALYLKNTGNIHFVASNIRACDKKESCVDLKGGSVYPSSYGRLSIPKNKTVINLTISALGKESKDISIKTQ
jgi:P pilus assembly chaperone PapD